VAAEGIELQLMPKISELTQVLDIDGNEFLPVVQAGSTVKVSAMQVAGLSSRFFAGLTGEVTSPFGSLVTTINKSINPVWLGTHVFGAGTITTLGQLPPATMTPNVVAQFMGRPDANNAGGIQVDGFAAQPTIWIRRANGTPTAPTAIKNGDYLGGIHTPSFDGAGYSPGVRFRGLATADWTTTSHPTLATIEAVAVNSSTPNPIANFYGSGGVGIGTPFIDPGANNLSVAGDVGIRGSLGVSGTGNVNGHFTANHMTVGAPPSTDTGPGDIYLTGGIGVNVGVVGASGTVNAELGYYINGDKVVTLGSDVENTRFYTEITAPGANGGLILVGDQNSNTNYHQNTFHEFNNVTGTVSFALIDVNGIQIGARKTFASLPISGGISNTVNATLSVITDGPAGLTPGAPAAGGGSTPYLVWHNGTAWTVIGK
jgi:hypothetical protein